MGEKREEKKKRRKGRGYLGRYPMYFVRKTENSLPPRTDYLSTNRSHTFRTSSNGAVNISSTVP